MKQRRNIIVFDFETDGVDTKTCNPVQIGACVIDVRNLTVYPDSQFNIKIRPDQLKEPDYFVQHKKTIEWHAKLRNRTTAEVLAEWSEGVPEKSAWKQFCDYCKEYQTSRLWTGLPCPGGHNVRNFDIPIALKLKEKHGGAYPFAKRDIFDLLDLSNYWFAFAKRTPSDYKLDTLRTHFGLSHENAHDALQDVLDTASLLINFLSVHKYVCALNVNIIEQLFHEPATAD